MDYIGQLGSLSLASRFRRLVDILTRDRGFDNVIDIGGKVQHAVAGRAHRGNEPSHDVANRSSESGIAEIVRLVENRVESVTVLGVEAAAVIDLDRLDPSDRLENLLLVHIEVVISADIE